MVKQIFLFVKEQVISLLLSGDYFMLGQLWLVWVPASLLIPVLWKIGGTGAICLCCVGTPVEFTDASEDKLWASKICSHIQYAFVICSLISISIWLYEF